MNNFDAIVFHVFNFHAQTDIPDQGTSSFKESDTARYLYNTTGQFLAFFQYLALDVTTNCICEIQCLALDGFVLNTVHKLSSKEKKKSRQSND